MGTIGKIYRFTSKPLRLKWYQAVLLSVSGVFFELLGLATLLPVIMLLFKADGSANSRITGFLYEHLGISNSKTFTVTVCLIMVGILVLKSCISYYINRKKVAILNRFYSFYSTLLFEYYYGKGLLYLKHKSTTKLVYHINLVAHAMVYYIFGSVLKIIAEVSLIVALLLVVMVLNFWIFLAMLFLFTPFMIIFYRYIKKRMEVVSDAENRSKEKQARIVYEVFYGYTEVEVGNAFPFFLREFENQASILSGCKLRTEEVSGSWTRMLEIGIFTGIIGMLLLSMLYSGQKVSLVLLVIAIIRMLPSFRSVFTAFSQIKGYSNSQDVFMEMVDDVLSGEHTAEPEPFQSLVFKHTLELNHLSFGYSSSRKIINNLNVTIRKGEKVGIRGRSGRGKSTLLHLLLGIYRPVSGSILVDGVELTPQNRSSWSSLIGYVSQDVQIFSCSLAKNIAFGIDDDKIDYDKLNQVVNQASLSGLVATLPEGMNSAPGERGSKISGGERQRIGIARALYRNPEVLIFDEATSSVDPATEKEIVAVVGELIAQQPDLTIIVVGHRGSTMDFCKRFIDL